MKQERLLQALDYISDGYLASAAESMSAPPQKRYGRKLAALAACLVLSVAILFTVLPRTGSPNLPVTEHRICEETLGGPIRVEQGEKNLHHVQFGGQYIGFFDKEANLPWYLAAEVSVVEVLPHIYEEPKTGERYRILRMHTHDAISGENMPEQFYFRLEEERSTALSEFDRLILGLRQTGVERYAMYNVETERMETFSLLFETSDPTEYGTVIAFEKDESGMRVSDRLRTLDGWSGTVSLAEDGAHRDTVKMRIREACREGLGAEHVPRVYTAADFYGNETAGVFDRMANAKDVVYVQTVQADGYGGKHITFTKYLNGFETSDCFNIFLGADGNAVLQKPKLDIITKEDAANAPLIAPLLRALDPSGITPPHTHASETMEITRFSAEGWYDKAYPDGELRALIKLSWYLSDGRTLYLDDLYFLVNSDGSLLPLEREELKAMIGNDKHLENAEYNVPLFHLGPMYETMPIAES